MKIPLSHIHPSHRNNFNTFLMQAQECFRTIGGKYPDGLFQPVIFLTSGWI
jgi:hypothetical protein